MYGRLCSCKTGISIEHQAGPKQSQRAKKLSLKSELTTSKMQYTAVVTFTSIFNQRQTQQVETKETTSKLTISTSWIFTHSHCVYFKYVWNERCKDTDKKKLYNVGHFVQLVTCHWIIFIFGAETQNQNNRGFSTACCWSSFFYSLASFWTKSTWCFSTSPVVVIRFVCVLQQTVSHTHAHILFTNWIRSIRRPAK